MRRRKFIENISLGTTGIILGGFTEELHCMDRKENLVFVSERLVNGFLNPPDTAKPHTWWHWREGRISKEAITAELEAMKQIGLGGVTMFSTSRMGESGPNTLCLSPEWHECVKHALTECDRLGLTFNFQNCAGWNGSGGPWITPDKNMMQIVHTKHNISGGAKLQLEAPPSWPQKGNTFYRDIAVLAFPTPSVWKDIKPLSVPKITSSFIKDPDLLNREIKDNAKYEEISELLIDAGESSWIQFEFPTEVICRSLTITGSIVSNPDEHRAVVLESNDGSDFREVVQLSSYFSLFHRKNPSVTHAIPQTTARFFRLEWKGPAKLVLKRVLFSSDPAIYSLNSKMGELGRTFISEPVLPSEKGSTVPFHNLIDLTNQLDTFKNLTWTAPSGKSWTVLRVGYRNIGTKNAPAAQEVTGLECDKFNPEAISTHFDHYAAEIHKDAVSVNSKSLTGITFDSWEVGSQNWSPVFREEFRKRRGYDVLNYLPVFAGFIIENRELTDRFLCDVRQTMSDLVSEIFFGGMRKLSNKYGLLVHSEDSGGCGETMVSDPVQHYLHVDVPMNEFGNTMKYAASAAHITGKQVVAIEAYTQGKVDWKSCPASLKAQGDEALCAGVNRFVFHTYAHNPDVDKIYPGPAFGPYGLAFSRGQTWWEMGRAWITYLSRCQYLLQQGKPFVDVLYFYGEEPGGPIPMVLEGGNDKFDKRLKLPKGYDYDLLPPEILINDLSFTKGRLVTSSGASYKLLVLRSSEKMSPEAVGKIKKLIQSGATVLGPRPTQSPGLNNYPKCDKIVDEIGKEVWGNCDGKTITRHSYGKGQVFYGTDIKEVLESMSLFPDFSIEEIDLDLRFIHRYIDGNDIYFISNGQPFPVNFTAKFRISGKKPEVWDPVTGEIKDVALLRHTYKETVIPLWLDSCASVFVLFRDSISENTTGKIVENNLYLRQKFILDGPWTVKFSKGWGAPESIEFLKLEDWSKRPENGIKYYSGTAIYSISFDWKGSLSAAILLDLGRVEVIAGVRLNDKDCEIVWTPPYRVDITKALKVGRNDIEIRVANTWLNRLMGDGLGINMGSEKRTWTTCNPFTLDTELTVPEISTRSMLYYKDLKREPVPSGLLGPVCILEQ